MTKILYAMNGVFRKGGIETVILNYFRYLDKERYHVDFLVHGDDATQSDNAIHQYLISQGSRIFYVPVRGDGFMKNKSAIRRVFRENHFDLVHSHMDAAGAFFLEEARRNGISARVAHSHSTDHQTHCRSGPKRIAYRIVLDMAMLKLRRIANLYLACSTEAGRWLFDLKPFTVLNNGIDPDYYAYNPELRSHTRRVLGLEDAFVLGHIGHFSYHKNHMLLLDIFHSVAAAVPNAKLLLIGEGELWEDVVKKINELGLTQRVQLLGNRDDIPELLQGMDIFLLPSRFEGLPLVGVEAQAAGLPCLFSDTISPEICITPYATRIAPDGPVDAWTRQVLQWQNYDRQDTREDITSSGYDIKQIVPKLQMAYDHLLHDN